MTGTKLLRLEKLLTGSTIRLLCTDAAVVDWHWAQGQLVPCGGPHGCLLCPAWGFPRCTAYVAASLNERAAPVLVGLPPTTWGLIDRRAIDWRVRRVRLTRRTARSPWLLAEEEAGELDGLMAAVSLETVRQSVARLLSISYDPDRETFGSACFQTGRSRQRQLFPDAGMFVENELPVGPYSFIDGLEGVSDD